jgi:hypothetical protein
MASYQQLQSPFFGLLPAELRINTYEHLLADFKGDKSTVGALLACSRFKHEIEPLMARIALQNLDAAIAQVKERWTQLHLDETPLAINIAVKRATVDETQVCINIPKLRSLYYCQTPDTRSESCSESDRFLSFCLDRFSSFICIS